MIAAFGFNHKCILSEVMKFAKRICYSCCALIWAALVFASLLTRHVRQVIQQYATTGSPISTSNPTYDPLGSEMYVSSASEEIWDQNFQCFDKSTVFLTLAFDVGRKGLTNQHIALLHGFAVASLLGAETIVEPKLWIGLKEISLQQLYDGTQISKALKELKIAVLPDPPNNVETVDLELQINMGGEPLRTICSRAQTVLRGKSKAKGVLLHLGLAAGLLRIEESNLGLISFPDKHLEYHQGIQTATQDIVKKLPTFNGLHLETYSYKTPKEVVPKLMEAGFHFDTPLFVASEVPIVIRMYMYIYIYMYLSITYIYIYMISTTKG